jgi:hypothetical protein
VLLKSREEPDMEMLRLTHLLRHVPGVIDIAVHLEGYF